MAQYLIGEEPEPDCMAEDGHDWQSPRFLGGCRENPGVWSHGGTAGSAREVCAHCGVYRVTRWTGSQRNPGEVPRTVAYEDADARSEAWAAGQA